MVVAYRGGDLPLRTPRSQSGAREPVLDGQIMPPGPDWLATAMSDVEDAPVLVDQTVLACCNQAFELALAHRSADVCLEHLVHAMTLVPDAIRALHEAGVSDTSLRRESGIIIAHDIPSVSGGPAFSPQTSDQMADVLRYAAALAYSRRSPVTIEDLLATLFDMTRDQETQSLLNRHRSEWNLREPIGRASRYVNGAANGAGPQPHTTSPPNSSANAQAGPEANMDIPTVTDSFQNTRIDALERTVRELAEALRHGTIGVQQPPPTTPPVHYTVETPRSNGGGRRLDDDTAGQVLGRLNEVEITVEQKFRELARTWNVLGDRLQTLEDRLVDSERKDGIERKDIERVTDSIDRLRGLETIPGRLDKIDSLVAKLDRLDRLDMVEGFDRKLNSLEETFTRVVNRLEGLESRLDDKVDGDFDLDPIRERLDAIGRQVGERPNMHAELAPLQQRLDVLSRQMTERMSDAGAVNLDLSPIATRLEQLEQTINERSTSGVDLGPVMDRMKELESRVGDNSLMVETITSRMDTFDGNVDAARAKMNEVSMEISGLGRSLDQRLQSISLGGGEIDPNLIVNAVSQPMQATVGELRTLIDADRKEQREQFEYLVQGLGKASQDHRNDLTEVHEAMLKLNGNQQTLAQSMDRWRLDVSGDLGVLASRLEQLETGFAARPAENSSRIEELAAQMQQVTTVLQRKEERRSGVLMWLFGTEDWWSDGWRTPEEREAAAAERNGYVTTVETTTYVRPEDRPLQG
jgi:tetrahydromethanopterin S-methyltransferase subunit B